MRKLFSKSAVLGAILGALLFGTLGLSAAASASPSAAGGSTVPQPDVPPPPGTTQKPLPNADVQAGPGTFTGPAASGLATADSIPLGSAPAEVQSVLSQDPCDVGWVCIYAGDIVDDPGSYHPMVYAFYYYGTYNLSGMYGGYTTINNQTGSAKVSLYYGYNATGGIYITMWPGWINYSDYTPINSVQLYP